MASRSLNDLHQNFQPAATEFLNACRELGYNIIVTCTYRSPDEQQQLYAQGRTKPGKIVTNAKPGLSAHNFQVNNKPASLAMDIVPLIHGKPIWDSSDPIWAELGRIGELHSLEWAGRWEGHLKETAHFQIRSLHTYLGD